MWIEEKQAAKGVMYRYYERYTDPLTGKIKKACVTLSSVHKQAQKQAQALLNEKIVKLTSKQPQKITFSLVGAEWLKHNEPALKLSTHKGNTYKVGKLIQLLPPDILISRITPAMIQHILYDLYNNRGLSFKYVKNYLIVIKGVLRYAKRMQYIHDISFLDDIELRQKVKTIEEVEQSRNRFLDKDELKNILAKLYEQHKRVALAMEFVSLTGLRFGELVALRAQDYNKADKTVYINGSISHIKNNKDEDRRGTPKNVHSIRIVTLNTRADQILNYFMLENKKNAAWFEGYIDHGYIFTSNRGNPMNIQYVNKALRSVQGAKKLSSHIFRHTHISILTELGIPIKAIMQRVGHNDPRTTLSIYTHVTSAMAEEVVQKLNMLSAR